MSSNNDDKIQQAIKDALNYSQNNQQAPPSSKSQDRIQSGIDEALNYAKTNTDNTPKSPVKATTPQPNNFMESIKSTVKGAAYGALSGVARLAGTAAEGGYQLEKYVIAPWLSPLIGKQKFADEIKTGEQRGQALIKIADQLDNYAIKKTTGLESIGYSAGTIVPDVFVPLMKNISNMIKAPVSDKDFVSKVGDVMGGVGSIISPGQSILAGAINVPFTTLDIMSGKKSINESYNEGVTFGAKFAVISGITSQIMKPILTPLFNKITTTEITSIKAAVQAIGNETNPLFKSELQKDLAGFIVKKVGKETIEGALGMGSYNAMLPAKDGTDRMNNFVEGIKQGALFSSVLGGLGIGYEGMFGKPQSFTPMSASKLEELKKTAGTYTPLDMNKVGEKPTFVEKLKTSTTKSIVDTTSVREALKIDPQKQVEAVKGAETIPTNPIPPEKIAAINDIQNAIETKYGQKLNIFDENGILKPKEDVMKEIKTLGLKSDSYGELIFNDIKNMTEDIKGQYEVNTTEVQPIPEATQPVETSVTLQSNVIPGAGKVIEETAASVHGIFAGINKVTMELQERFAPAEIGRAKQASGILSQMKSEAINGAAMLKLKYKSIEEGFNKFKDNQLAVMFDNYEKTGLFAKGMEEYSAQYRQRSNAALDLINSVFQNNPIQGVDNYIRHAFKFTNPADETKFVEGFGRSFKGFSTSPFKKRVFSFMSEAETYMQAQGIKYEIVSRNPETLLQWTEMNAKKLDIYTTGINELKSKELIHFVKTGADVPANFAPLDDKFAKVFFSGDQGQVLAGQYFAPAEVARIMNNTVSKGLFKNSPILASIREVNNTMNALQLGLSAFHALTETVGSMASDVGLGIQEIIGGRIIQGTKRIATSTTIVYPIFQDFMKGNSLINDLSAGKQEAITFVQNVLNPSGGRLGIETGYKMQAIERFTKSWSEGNITGTVVNLPLAFVEKVAQPLMEYAVPRVKIGLFMKEAESALERVTQGYTKEINPDAKRKLLNNIWSRIDDIHGQMVQDNLFWNNAQKDLANLTLRSFGWTYGTQRGIGAAIMETADTIGAVKGDVISAIKGQEGGNLKSLMGERGGLLTAGMAKVFAYPLAVGYISAVYQFMNTGKMPSESLDYFFPKNGETGTDGKPVRVSIPGYMKDMFSYSDNPLTTMKNKLSPEIQFWTQLLQNKDYYNVMIRNDNDHLSKQLFDVGKYALGQTLPFAFRNFLSGQAETANSKQTGVKDILSSIMGFSKAPKYVSQTDTERTIGEEFKRVVGIKTYTPQEWNIVMSKVKAKSDAKGGDYTAMKQLLKEGVYTKQGYNTVKSTIQRNLKKGGNTYQSLFSELPKEVQKTIWDRMSPEEQQQYQKFANKQMFKIKANTAPDTSNEVPIY